MKEKWRANTKDGDTAMALFAEHGVDDEPIDPKEERRILWKIDLMILPYLAICYAFFYIDKVCRQARAQSGNLNAF